MPLFIIVAPVIYWIELHTKYEYIHRCQPNSKQLFTYELLQRNFRCMCVSVPKIQFQSRLISKTFSAIALEYHNRKKRCPMTSDLTKSPKIEDQQ